MDRAERTGLGVAVAAHAALFAALSLNLLKPPALPKIDNDPIEVSIVDRVSLESSAPNPSEAAEPAPVEAAPAPQPEPLPPVTQPTLQPTVKPAPKAPPKPVTRPAAKSPPPSKAVAKPATARSQPPRKSGLSRDLVSGLSDTPNVKGTAQSSSASGTPAKVASAAVTSSIGAEIRRQLKPHWKSPTGADVEMLRTTVTVRLNRDGSIDGTPTLDTQTGVNESNRSQAKLHVDQAIRAVRLAAPFKLPTEYYDAWKVIRPTFDKRLSQ